MRLSFPRDLLFLLLLLLSFFGLYLFLSPGFFSLSRHSQQPSNPCVRLHQTAREREKERESYTIHGRRGEGRESSWERARERERESERERGAGWHESSDETSIVDGKCGGWWGFYRAVSSALISFFSVRHHFLDFWSLTPQLSLKKRRASTCKSFQMRTRNTVCLQGYFLNLNPERHPANDRNSNVIMDFAAHQVL